MITTQLTSDSLARIADRFSDPEFLARGCVQTICLGAVRERLGRRWSLRRDVVRDVVMKQFRKDFAPADLISEVDETRYLLLQPNVERYAAEAKAIGLLRDVLEFLLGSSAPSDLAVATVAAIRDGVIEQMPVSLESLERRKPAGETSCAAAAGPTAKAEPSVATESRSWAVQGEADYTVRFVVEPIWSVKKRAIVTHRLKPLIFRAPEEGERQVPFARLSIKDRIRMDVVILAEAARLLEAAPEGARFGLHVPINQATLSSTAGRQAVLWRLQDLGPLSHRLVPCLHGFERGVPASRLAEFIAPLQRRCLGVSVRAPDLDTDPSAWRGLNPSAVSIDIGDVVVDASTLQQRLRRFALRCRDVAPAIVACSLQSRAQVLMAWAEGFTHIAGDVLAQRTCGDLTPIRFAPGDLYPERQADAECAQA